MVNQCILKNGHHVTHNIFKCISFNDKGCILNKKSTKFVHKGNVDNRSPLVQVMVWHQKCDMPLPESVIAQFIDTT